MFGFVRSLFSRSSTAPAAARTLRMRKADRAADVQAKYDAAQTTELNRRYWRNADYLSADSANSAEVRRILRSRARYEIHEANGIGKGMVLTLANDTIGRGPRLQMLTQNPEVNRRLEAAFMRWSHQVRLAKKLRTMRMAKCVDGEAFALFTNNPKFPEVQLDLRLIEAEQIATPMFSVTPGAVDGIELDDHGNPAIYHLLKSHPGSAAVILGDEFDRIDADDMLHIFRCDRPSLHRGIPEITPSLPLFALLRDYVLAVLHNVRSAAKFTLLLETQSGAVDDSGVGIDPDVSAFDAVDIDYDMMTALPHGYKASQLSPAHPVSSYAEYTQGIIGQIGRPLSMPLNVALMVCWIVLLAQVN
ncbi:MAG: phage portal protein, partial [Planctomycetaceae bacterium]